MRVEQHRINDLHCYRYAPQQADYALVVSHGLGGHGGIYDIFGEHHAGKNCDIWSYSAPGHGQSRINSPRGQWHMAEWAQAGRDVAKHVKQETGLPVFLLGSSLGVGAAISGIDSEDVHGVICMGSAAIPGSDLLKAMGAFYRSDEVKQLIETLGRAAKLDIRTFFDFDTDYGWKGAQAQKELDSDNSWSYDLASWASLFQYDPPVAPGESDKPIYFTYGEDDPMFPEGAIDMIKPGLGPNAEVNCFKGASHQLMLFHTADYSTAIDAWCRKQF